MIDQIKCWPTRAGLGLFSVLIASLPGTSLLIGQEPPVTDIAFAPDGESLIACSQKGLQVFSWPKLKLQSTVKVSLANLHCLEFSPDGNQLAVGGGNPSETGGIEIFSWPENQSKIKLFHHDDSVMSVFWQGNHILVAASLDRLLTRWDLKTKKTVKIYQGHSRGVSSVCLLNNGEMVTAGHDQSVRVWDIESGKLIRTLNQHTKPINSMAAWPGSTGKPMVATAAGDRTIRFWQPTIGRMMRYIRLESEPLDIAWINESQIIASCVDGQARLVDAENVTVLRTLPVIQGWAYAIAPHPNDQTIAIAGSDGQIHRMRLQKNK